MATSIVIVCILLAFGIFLVLAELLIPGGISGTIGALIILGTVIYSFFAFGPTVGVAMLVGSILFFLAAFWLWLKYVQKLPGARDVFHNETSANWHGTNEKNREWLGREGTAQTMLRPSGFAMIDDERVDVVTQGEMVQPGTAVKVIEVEGNRIVVAAADSPLAQAVEPSAEPEPADKPT